jgi:hypothetical protein
MILTLLFALSLYDQAVARLLAARFPATEYLLVEAHAGRVIAANRLDPSHAIAVGSLTKPFLAVGGRDREFTCEPGMCWLPRGHGVLRLTEAIAQSCNAWFLQYASASAPSVRMLPAPPSIEAVTLVGLRPDWRIAPLTLLRAYSKVADPRVREGMLGAATHGTAQGVGMPALAKTGTAACSHRGGGPGDGLVVTVWPPEEPRYVLMVRVHGTTGAMAARKAGELLRTVRDGR